MKLTSNAPCSDEARTFDRIAPPPSSSALGAAIVSLAALLPLVGCDAMAISRREPAVDSYPHRSDSHPREGSRGTRSDANVLELDAGIIFKDEPTYLCLPLERFGLESNSQISSIKSTCECVQPSLVHYRAGESIIGEAVRIDLVGTSDDRDDGRISNLRVELLLELVGGEQRLATVSLLLTSLAGGESLPEQSLPSEEPLQ